jgi:hypothetical protein
VAHDCGLIVNPNGMRNQVEGNVIQGTSKELFYLIDNKIMVVTYTASGDSFRAGKPQLWSPGQFTDRLRFAGPSFFFSLRSRSIEAHIQT